MSVATNLAIHAATMNPTHATTDTGAIGIIIIYAVGFLLIAGVFIYVNVQEEKERKKIEEQQKKEEEQFKKDRERWKY